MQLKAFCLFLLACCLAAVAHATPIITAGNWYIANKANQSFDGITAERIAIRVSGGDPIQGVNLALNVTSGPWAVGISAVDLIGPGTIFHGNSTGQTDLLPFGGLDQFSLTTTLSGSVPADGVLAYIEFDGSAIPALSIFNFNLTNVIGSTDLPPVFTPTLVDGTVTVDPEPASLVLALFAAAAFCLAALRHRRRLTRRPFRAA